MQRTFIIGNLVADPDTRSTQNGVTVCGFTVAVNRRFANRDGERQTDFYRVAAWRQLGENCGRYLSKGKKVAVIGELQPRLYTTQNGETRMSLDLQAEEVEFLSPREHDSASVANGTITPDAPVTGGEWQPVNQDDLPF